MSNQLNASISHLALSAALAFLDGLIAKGHDIKIEPNGYRVKTVRITSRNELLGEGERFQDALIDLVARQGLANA